MHKRTISFILLLMGLSLGMMAQAQNSFTVTTDPKHPEQKMLVGAINKQLIATDTAFGWYASSYQYYTPDAATVTAFKDHPEVRYLIFGGTWCEDTQTIVPKFYKLLEQAGIAETQLSFFAVDRDKKTYGNLTEALGVTLVPTIIAFKDGKELGRVVEYGTTGNWDKELAAFLK